MQSKSSGSGSTNFFEVRSGAAPFQTLFVVTGDSLFESVDVLDDMTGDGIEELVVGDTVIEGGPGAPCVAKYESFQVRTPPRCLRSRGMQAANGFGSFVRSVGDITGDGQADFAASFRASLPTTIRVLSSSDGALLHTLMDPTGTDDSKFGDAIAGAGDVNGDGRDDWLVGTVSSAQPFGMIETYGLVQEEIVLDFDFSDDFVTPLPNGAALERAFGSLVRISSRGVGQVGPAPCDSSNAGPSAGGADPDLLVERGNLLILQENATQTTPGIYDVPGDAREGGTLLIELLRPMEPRSLVPSS